MDGAQGTEASSASYIHNILVTDGESSDSDFMIAYLDD